jgi:hypothetical protein
LQGGKGKEGQGKDSERLEPTLPNPEQGRALTGSPLFFSTMSIISDIAAATKSIVGLYPSEVLVFWKDTPNSPDYNSRKVSAAAHGKSLTDTFDDMGSRTVARTITVTLEGSNFSNEEILLLNKDSRLETDGIRYKVLTVARTVDSGLISIGAIKL